MSIRISENCLTCGNGKIHKIASYPSRNKSRVYLFECDNCYKNITFTGNSPVVEDIEYIKTVVETKRQ